jgi:hypothetical protein
MRPAAELHSLQVAIKRLDQTLLSMADIDDMTDELQEADEKNGKHRLRGEIRSEGRPRGSEGRPRGAGLQGH